MIARMLRASIIVVAASTLAAQQPPARSQPTAPPQRRDSATQSSDSARGGSAAFNGLRFRAIGPALTSGRISDLAVHPRDPKIWFVAVASGGVFRTSNAGNTWTPVF